MSFEQTDEPSAERLLQIVRDWYVEPRARSRPGWKDYRRLPIAEQVEVASLIGDIALADGEPKLHAHIVVTKRDGSAWGGHLLEGHVRPTLEVLVVESPAYLYRKHDPSTGLPLIAL